MTQAEYERVKKIPRKFKNPGEAINITANKQRCEILRTLSLLPVEPYREMEERVDTARRALLNAVLDDIESLYAPNKHKFKATFTKLEPEPGSMEVEATCAEEALHLVEDALQQRGQTVTNLSIGVAEHES